MVVFPNAKINLGLNIVAKRKDGFHDIVTCFYPLPLTDVLEIVESPGSKTSFHSTGIAIPGKEEENLCMKAYKLLRKDYQLPHIEMHLHKILPIGAGLGGGSADAAYTLSALNEMFQLFLDASVLEDYAAKLGSDCPFFVRNKPVMAFERGDVFGTVNVDLGGKKLLLIYPEIHISSAQAYSRAVPQTPELSVKEIIENEPIERWNDNLKNDFETTILEQFPKIRELKEAMYRGGAIYASMSGSGSAVFGFFEADAAIPPIAEEYTQRWEMVL